MALFSRKQTVVEPEVVPTVTPVVELSSFMQRINAARAALENADPARQDLTFPPVDMQLRLDEKTRF